MGRSSSRKPSSSNEVSKDSEEVASVIAWVGEAREDREEQKKHYTAFCSGDTQIKAHSFVYVKTGKRKFNVAYVRDLYEKDGKKLASVQWFDFPREVGLRKSEAHPKEILIRDNTEVEGVECIDGVATVLTPNHFEEWLQIMPEDECPEEFVCFLCRRKKVGIWNYENFAIDALEGYDVQTIVGIIREKQESEKEEDAKRKLYFKKRLCARYKEDSGVSGSGETNEQ